MKKRFTFILTLTALLFLGTGNVWGAQSLPYSYGFEDYNLAADGWTKFFGTSLTSNNNECAIVGAAKHTGSYGFRFSSYQTSGANAQYLISPELNAPTGVELSFVYKASSTSGTEVFKVGYSTTDASISSFEFGDEISTKSTSWKTYEGSFPAGTKYIAIYYYANYQYRLYVDNFAFEAGSASATCPVPTSLTKGEITATSATFTWTAGGEESSWQYLCLPAAESPNWESSAVETVNTPSATVSVLPATAYKFYVRSYCAADDQSGAISVAFKTPCGAISVLPYTENFDGIDDNVFPDCWQYITTSSTLPKVYNYGYYANSSPKSLYVYGGSASTPATIIFPPFEADIKTLALSFYYQCSEDNPSWGYEYGHPYIGYITDPTDVSTFKALSTALDQKSGSELFVDNFSLSGAPSGAYIAIQYKGNGYNGGLYLDDITVARASSCTKPTGIDAVSSITPTSASVSWTGEASQYQYIVVSAGGAEDWSTPTLVSAKSASLTGLAPNTSYDFYVRSYCSASEQSGSVKTTFRTPCGAVTSFPWTEDFTGMAEYITPECWDNSASTTSTLGTYPYYVWGTIENSSNMMLQLYNGMVQSGAAVINTPLFAIPNETDYELLFDYSHKANCGAFKLKVSVDGAPFAELGTYTNEAGTTATYPGAWTTESISLASFANHTIQFQFSANANYGSGCIYIDNIKVRKAPTCITPSGLTVSNIGSASANLSWTAGASEAAWVVQYKADGAADWTEKAVSTTPSCTLTELAASTTYYVQIKADCGAGDYSEPSAQQTFKTTCAAESLPFEEDFGNTSALPDCWNVGKTGGSYQWAPNYETYPDYYLQFRTGTGSTYSYLQTPPIELTEDALLSFDWRNSGSNNADLRISTNSGTTFTSITNDLSNTQSSWTTKTFDLSAYTGQTVIIEVQGKNGTASKYLRINNFSVKAKPCDLLTNVKVQPTMDGGTVTWTGDAKKLQYREGTAGAWSAVAIAEADKAKPHTLTDLSASTLYQVRALSICGDESDEAAWTAPISFTTKCAPSSVLPYENDFEAEAYNSGTLPDCWGKITTSTDYPQVAQGALAYGGSGNFLQFQGSEDQIAVLPAFTADLSTLTIQFFYRYHYADFQLGYVKADGATFVPIETLTQSAAYGEAPYEKDLAAIPADAVYLALRMTNASSLSAQACVDNLVIKETPTCSKPTNLTISAITSEGATFAWNVSEKATENQYQYCVVATGVAPSDWTLLDENVRTVTITGKNAHTAYDFYVRSYCGSSDQSETVKLTFTTACAVISALPWEHDFESDETFDIPECWDALDNSGTSYVLGSNGHNAAKSLYVAYGRTTNYQTVILPKFDAELNTLYISFWYKGSAGANYGTVQVGYITDVTDQSTFVAVGEPFAPASEYQNAEVPFTGITADARIAIRYAGGTSDGELYIDDIRVAEISACARPADLAAVATSDGAALTWSDDAASEWTVRYSIKDANSWTEVEHIAVTNHTLSDLTTGTEYEAQVKAVCGVGSESDWSEKVLFTPVCNLPTDLTVVSTTQTSARITWESLESAWNLQYKAADAGWTSVNNIAVKDYLLGGLTAGTAYQVRVQATCGGETFSAPVSFTTMCMPSDVLPYENDFESESVNLLPACWSKVPEAEYPKVINGGASYGGEGKCLCFFGDSEQMVVLPAFTEPMANLNISFFYKNNTSSLEIGYVESDFVTFHKLADLANLVAYDANVFEMSLSAAPAEAVSIAIRFVGTDAYTSQAYFDNLRVRKTPTCLKPTDLAVSSITANSASVSWTENGTAAAWNLQYKLASAADWTTVAITEKPYNLSGLAQGTNYKVRVQAACAGEELSDWSDEAEFTTSCEAVTAIPYTETFDGALSNCWNVTDDETSVYAHSVYDGELRLPGGKAVSGHLVVLPEITASLANATMTIEYTATSGANTATPQVGYIDGESAFQELGTLSKSNSATKAFVALAAADGHRLALRYDDGTAEGDFNIREIRVSHVEIFEDVEGANNVLRLEALKSAGPIDAVFARPILRDGHYNTLCLPFDLSAAQLADSKCPFNGFEVRNYDHSDVDVNNDIVDIYLRTVGSIEAGKACFVRLVEGTLDRLAMADFRDVTIKTSTITPTDDNASGIHYIGIFDPHDLIGNSSANLYLSTDNALYIPASDTKMKGFRAYFGVDAGGPASAPIRRGAQVRIVEHKDSTTDINAIGNEHTQAEKHIENNQVIIIRNGIKYTVQGQMIQ